MSGITKYAQFNFVLDAGNLKRDLKIYFVDEQIAAANRIAEQVINRGLFQETAYIRESVEVMNWGETYYRDILETLKNPKIIEVEILGAFGINKFQYHLGIKHSKILQHSKMKNFEKELEIAGKNQKALQELYANKKTVNNFLCGACVVAIVALLVLPFTGTR